ncbi:ExeM/NucH family extracellular endonuclease [Aeromicrobium sp. Sec7.5]|uniref:ExeM/NucH family extracellular endonuclease n=1 Tax=Aeromicrobium sp. Sec7.5 TaxID=3121276 RepID=UPI002FE4CD92
MSRTPGRASRRLVPTLAVLATLTAGLLGAVPAQAAPDGSGPVIAELYVNGGSANAPFRNKFVELHNPTGAPIDLDGWSLQYRSPTGTGSFQAYALEGTIPAGGDFLVQGGSNASNGVPLTGVDDEIGINPGANGGVVALVNGTDAVTNAVTGDVASDPDWVAAGGVDLVGYGNANTFEGAAATNPAGTTDPKAMVRAGSTDTDVNSADLTLSATVTPCGATGCQGEEEPVDPTDATIAEIQGTTDVSPLAGQTVTTQGVVTAAFPTGGLDGVYLQTSGTGGAYDPDAAASHGIFVYSKAVATEAEVGQLVEVTGTVSEYFGLTQISPASSGFSVLEGPGEVLPTSLALPLPLEDREALEGMLVQLDGDFTVTNNYDTHTFGEIGLAAGTEPLVQPTEVVAPGTPEYTAKVAENAALAVTLDDGSSANFAGGAKDVDQTWLTADNEIRVGAAVELTEPLVLDYRFDTWRVQPTAALTADGPKPAVIEDGLRAAEEKPEDVGGDLQVASFNVLNYFSTTGQEFVDAELGTCTYYNDRTGAPITNNRCTPDGPRGAADDENLARQQVKIVEAINTLGADVVGLAEIENSAAFGQDRDAALDTLVAALNADTGEDNWAAVPSPAVVPTNGGTDVIRSAFIYRVDAVEVAGESSILDDPAFVNARAPLAQAFRPKGGDEESTFVVVANHFKSKGSGSGEDADQGDGQSASNASRVKQATALVGFTEDLESTVGTDQLFLIGDFNSYTMEDPLQVLETAGFVNVGAELDAGATYLFQGRVGSLDHVFASASAFERVTGADTWDINADEPLGREYSRYNSNATLLYDESVFRSSDHDPTLVGYDPGEGGTPGEPASFTDTVGTTFATEIAWLAGQGIATGYANGDGTFSFQPSAAVLREQMAAFLYRYANDGANPPADTPDATFSDTVSNTFSQHIAWLAGEKITTGYADGTFRPSAPVLREQMAAFLYRLAGSPPISLPLTGSPFADVEVTDTFYTEIVWLDSTKVTTGYAGPGGTRTFRGSQPVLREQMAAFLFRFDQLER